MKMNTETEQNNSEPVMADVNQQGQVTVDDWRVSLPEDIRGHEAFSEITDVGSLASKYLAASRAVGGDVIPMPKTDEEISEVFKKLGCPEDESGYVFDKLEGIDGNPEVEEIDNLLKKSSMKASLTTEQAKRLRNEFYQMSQERFAKEAEETRARDHAAGEALRKEFGAAFNSKMSDANMIANMAGDGFKQALIDADLHNNPLIIKGLLKLGEGRLERSGGLPGAGPVTTSDIEAEIKTLEAHPGYMDAEHPQHKFIVKKVYNLRQKKNGEV